MGSRLLWNPTHLPTGTALLHTAVDMGNVVVSLAGAFSMGAALAPGPQGRTPVIAQGSADRRHIWNLQGSSLFLFASEETLSKDGPSQAAV